MRQFDIEKDLFEHWQTKQDSHSGIWKKLKKGLHPSCLRRDPDRKGLPLMQAPSSLPKSRRLRKRRRESFYKRTQAYSYKTLTPDAETKHMKPSFTIDPNKTIRWWITSMRGGISLCLKRHVEIMVGRTKIFSKRGNLSLDSSIAHKLRNVSDEESQTFGGYLYP